MEVKNIQEKGQRYFEEIEKIYNASYEYKSQNGIFIVIKGNLFIEDIKVDSELLQKENFNELLKESINEVLINVKNSVNYEIELFLRNNGEI